MSHLQTRWKTFFPLPETRKILRPSVPETPLLTPHTTIAMHASSVMIALTLGFAMLIGYLVHDVTQALKYEKQVQWSDSTCRKIETPTPCEDIASLGDNGLAFAGGGDIWSTFHHGSKQAKDGAIWLVNTNEATVRKLAIEGDAVPPKLILHGIYYSKTSKRLYAVNHDEAVGESIEVFELLGEAEPELKLRHFTTIRHSLFGNFVLNDVIEGADKNELYVTEWQPFAFPRGGKRSPTATLKEKLQCLGMTLATIFKIPLTRVFRCAAAGPGAEWSCSVAAKGFAMANGITISHDRQTIFVNDAVANTITVMERLPQGALKTVSSFKTKHGLDNIDMAADGKHLNGGTVPLPYTCGTVCEDAAGLSATKTVDGREVGCGRQPGSMLQISLLGTGGKSYVDGTQVDKAMHDGSKLDGVASAIQIQQKILLSGPSSPGLLICEA